MASIFLSYSHVNRDCAKALAKALETAGHDVWWDRRLDGGEEFSAEIEAALDKAEAVVVAWSKESVKSRWVRDEAAAGCEKNMLVPVSIDGSMPPMGFRQFHTLDLTGWKGAKSDERTTDFLHTVNRRLLAKAGVAPAAAKTLVVPRLPLLSGRRLWAVAALLMLAAGMAIGLFLYAGRDLGGGTAKPTIALLPFNTASPDTELNQLAAQSRESIARTFSQSGLPVRLLGSTPKDGALPVDFLLGGDFSRSGDQVVASIRLDEAGHGVTIFSRRFEASGDEIRHLADRIGAQMAAGLTGSVALGILDQRHPLDPALMADLMGDFDSELQEYQVKKRAAASAPNFQVTQLGLAFSTSFALVDIPRGDRDEAVAEARRAAERAIALGPNLGDAYGAWCLLHSETKFAECEDRLRAAKRVDPDAPWLNTFLSHLLRHVGRVDEAMDLAKMSYTRDVYLPVKIAWMLKTLEFANEKVVADELYEQGARWWPEYKPMFFRNRLYGLLERGDFDAIQQLEQELGATKLLPGYRDSGALGRSLRSKSIPGARRACGDADNFYLNVRCMLALAMIGDQDGAYAIADKLYPRRVGRTPAETERIWLDLPDTPPLEFITSPAAAAMRRDPRYLRLAERVGLLAYWRGGRPPDFCGKPREPVCAELIKRR